MRQLGDPIHVASATAKGLRGWKWDFRDAEMEKRGNKMKRKVVKDRHVFLEDRIP